MTIKNNSFLNYVRMAEFRGGKKIPFIIWKYGKIYTVKELFSIVSHKNTFNLEWDDSIKILDHEDEFNFLRLNVDGDKYPCMEPIIKYIDTNFAETNIFVRSIHFSKWEHGSIQMMETNKAHILWSTTFLLCFSHGLIIIGKLGRHNGEQVCGEIMYNDPVISQYVIPLIETQYRTKILNDIVFSNQIRSGKYKKLIINGLNEYKKMKDVLGNYFSIGTDGENLYMEKTFWRNVTAATYDNYDFDENLPVEVEMKKLIYDRHKYEFWWRSTEIKDEDFRRFNRPTYTVFQPKNKILLYYFKRGFHEKMNIGHSHQDFLMWCKKVENERSLEIGEHDGMENENN
jgi:hypothetical protein